jgi:hypothetical protein
MWCLFDMLFDAYAMRMLMIKLLIVFNIWGVTLTGESSEKYDPLILSPGLAQLRLRLVREKKISRCHIGCIERCREGF